MANSIPKKSISFLGDSLTAYEGTIPKGYPSFYSVYNFELRDMWWKHFLRRFDLELAVNNSFAGSTVYHELYSTSTSDERCSNLGDPDNLDYIIIQMGYNDIGLFVEIRDFESDYCIMLQKLKSNYPKTKIIASTLIAPFRKIGRKSKANSDDWVIFENYNDAIRRAVEKEGVLLADLAEIYRKGLPTLDGLHPNKDGQHSLYIAVSHCFEELKGVD